VTFAWLIAMRKTLSGKLRRKSVPVQPDTRNFDLALIAFWNQTL
jgi:hypothetical protein